MQKYKPTPNVSLAGSVAGEESRAVGGSIRLLGAPENHRAGCFGGQHTPDERDSRKNYSTAVEDRNRAFIGSAAHSGSRNASERRTNSAPSSVSGRRRPSIPLRLSAPPIDV